MPEPIAARERARFWSELDERFRAIAVRRPGRVKPDDKRKILAACAVRIARLNEIEEIQASIKAANNQAARKHKARARQTEPAG
jgi:hypothetical protein